MLNRTFIRCIRKVDKKQTFILLVLTLRRTKVFDDYSAPGRVAEYCDEHICMSVSLSTLTYLRNHMSSFVKDKFVCGHGLVLFWRHCSTSGFCG